MEVNLRLAVTTGIYSLWAMHALVLLLEVLIPVHSFYSYAWTVWLRSCVMGRSSVEGCNAAVPVCPLPPHGKKWWGETCFTSFNALKSWCFWQKDQDRLSHRFTICWNYIFLLQKQFLGWCLKDISSYWNAFFKCYAIILCILLAYIVLLWSFFVGWMVFFVLFFFYVESNQMIINTSWQLLRKKKKPCRRICLSVQNEWSAQT